MMTPAACIKCRNNDSVATLLLATGDRKIVESCQHDSCWDCGRDGRGHNTFGKLLMAVRYKLLEKQVSKE
jgi:predicted NAD-dependent protein-ADP-ribosyltransferase YbiA (DUF1768 family)